MSLFCMVGKFLRVGYLVEGVLEMKTQTDIMPTYNNPYVKAILKLGYPLNSTVEVGLWQRGNDRVTLQDIELTLRSGKAVITRDDRIFVLNSESTAACVGKLGGKEYKLTTLSMEKVYKLF